MTIGAASFGTTPVGVDPEYTFLAAASPEKFLLMNGLLSDAAVITSPDTLLMPAANMQNVDPTSKCRTSSSNQTFLFSFPGPTRCNCLFWGAHNGSPSLRIRVKAGNTAAAEALTSVSYDSGWKSAWPLGGKPRRPGSRFYNSLIRLSNTDLWPYYQVEVSDPGVGVTYHQVGRAMLDWGWQPSRNPSFGVNFEVTNNDSRKRTSRNVIKTGRYLPGRVLRLPFGAALESEADHVMDLQLQLGTALDLAVSLDPASTAKFQKNTLHGTFASTGRFEPIPVIGFDGEFLSKFDLELEEL